MKGWLEGWSKNYEWTDEEMRELKRRGCLAMKELDGATGKRVWTAKEIYQQLEELEKKEEEGTIEARLTLGTRGATICKRCRHRAFGSGKPNYKPNYTISSYLCLSPGTPYSDFVMGIKLCKDINQDGHCVYYKQREEESHGKQRPEKDLQ